MDDNKPKDSGKLKLRNTDTNRFKVDTGRLRLQPTAETASEISKQGPGETQQSTAFVDPLSLRDTSTGKLKRLDGQGAVGTTIIPASAAAEKKTETVRLKVVRATPRPGTPTPPPSAAPLANVPLSAPAETAEASDEGIRPGATTNIAAEYPQEPIVGEHVSPTAAKISLKAPEAAAPQEAPAPAEASTQGVPRETDTFQKVAPTKPAAAVALTAQELPRETVTFQKVSPAKPDVTAEATVQGLSRETGTFQKVSPAKPGAPAASTVPGLSRETGTFQKVSPAKPGAAEAVPSSTIKLTVKKPTGTPLPSTGSAPAPAPAPAPQPTPQEATPASPKLPSTATTGLKIRPPTAGGTTVTPPPTADSGQTAQVAPPSSAAATVKVSPSAILPPSTGAKISLKKDLAPEPEVSVPPVADAPAEPAAPSNASATVAVKLPPAPESPAGGTGKKGLRLSGKAGKTVSVPAPGATVAKTDEAPAASAKAAVDSVLQPGTAPVVGISALEGISALVATVALAVTLFSMVMNLLK